MKILTQDAKQYLDFGECYMQENGIGYGVYVCSLYRKDGILVGWYPDELRARGVLYELGLAYSKGDKIFRMPGD